MKATTTRQRVEEAHRNNQRWDFLAAQRYARREFARERGWRFTSQNFCISELLRGKLRRASPAFCEERTRELHSYGVLDHTEYLKEGGRPVALLSHSYCEEEKIEAFAKRNLLRVEYLPYSWYYPGGTRAALLIPVVAPSTAPTGQQYDAALKEISSAAEAERQARLAGCCTLEIRQRRDAAAMVVNLLREWAIEAFAKERGLRLHRSAHHQDEFVAVDDRRKGRAKVIVTVYHGHDDSSVQKYGAFKDIGERLPFSWCHGTMGWSVAVTSKEVLKVFDIGPQLCMERCKGARS